MKQSFAIGKAIEDPRIINFCEKKLKELDGIEDNENSSCPPASKTLFQTIASKPKFKK
ncbi:MAG TPA: hypothetical protein VN414_05585 [Methanosarcina sp.]|nr:hypothetical protein [Methanosarcina sp.]